LIVLDTHALIWWVNGDLETHSPAAAAALAAEGPDGDILISAITAWEVAMLSARGRLSLAMEVSVWLAIVAEIESVRFVSIDWDLGVKAVELPGEFHKDPADRLIVATARSFDAAIVTADEKIRAYPHVRSVW
jgi:PIN domain nuclease of toxin-antitoxin system